MVKDMKRTIVIMLALLFCGQTAWSRQLTLDEAITSSIENNPQIQSERAKIGISDAQIKTAGLLTNPKMVLDASIADKSYKGGIEQTIQLGGKRHQVLQCRLQSLFC